MGCSVCRFFQPLLSACYFGTWRQVPHYSCGAGGVFVRLFLLRLGPAALHPYDVFTVIFCVLTALAVSRVVSEPRPCSSPR